MKRFLPIGVLILAALLPAAVAQAHPNLLDRMWVRFDPDCVHVAVNVSLREIAVAQGDALGGNNFATLRSSMNRHADYVLGHLVLKTQAGILPGRVRGIAAPPSLRDPENTFCQYDLEYPLSGARPGEVVFLQDMLREWSYAAGTAWNVSYVASVKSFGSPAISVALLADGKPASFRTGLPPRAGPQQAPAPGRDPGRGVFSDYFRHGVVHILTGYDHLLFVSALVIAAMSFWEMARVIAAFTLAHTLTLALSAFGICHLPAFIVEPVISLSIVFVALENILRPARANSRVRLAVAFGFGLIHGLGFAGGLLDAMAGLPAAGTWIALAAFSLGVEVGHQLVVLPLFAALAHGRSRLPVRTYSAMRRAGSAAISCLGAYYLLVAVQTQILPRL